MTKCSKTSGLVRLICRACVGIGCMIWSPRSVDDMRCATCLAGRTRRGRRLWPNRNRGRGQVLESGRGLTDLEKILKVDLTMLVDDEAVSANKVVVETWGVRLDVFEVACLCQIEIVATKHSAPVFLMQMDVEQLVLEHGLGLAPRGDTHRGGTGFSPEMLVGRVGLVEPSMAHGKVEKVGPPVLDGGATGRDHVILGLLAFVAPDDGLADVPEVQTGRGRLCLSEKLIGVLSLKDEVEQDGQAVGMTVQLQVVGDDVVSELGALGGIGGVLQALGQGLDQSTGLGIEEGGRPCSHVLSGQSLQLVRRCCEGR